MLLDNGEKARRLESGRNLLNFLPKSNCTVVQLHNNHSVAPSNGRGIATAISPGLQVIAGVLAKTEKVSVVARALEINESSVRNAAHSKDPEVSSAIERTTEKIRDLALNKLMASLGIVNDETLSQCGAKDASTVARNLAGVVEKLSPKDVMGSNVTLVVYAPQLRNEKHYDTIEVKALP